MFSEPGIVQQLDELVWLNVPWEMSCVRRFTREARHKDLDDFRALYKEHIHAAHRSWEPLLHRNVAHRNVHQIDASAGEKCRL